MKQKELQWFAILPVSPWLGGTETLTLAAEQLCSDPTLCGVPDDICFNTM